MIIKRLLAILFIVVPLLAHAQQATNVDTSHLHVFKRGELVDVYIEPQLYDMEGSDHFFLRVILRNKTEKVVGLDLVVDPYWSVLFPNQYVIQNAFDQEHPMIEHQITPLRLSHEEKDYMLKNHEYGELTMMKPGTFVEYFRDFTGFHKKKVKLKENQKITLSFDGQMFVTDGKKIEEFNCFKETDVNRFVMVYHPAKMHHVPPKAFVLDKPEGEEYKRK